MSYAIYGPFSDGVAPGVAAAFLNALEAFLVSVNSLATDGVASSDGSGNATVATLKIGTTNGTLKIGGNMGSGHILHVQDSTGYEPFQVINGGISVAPNNTSTPSLIKSGTAGLGIKQANGTKIMEVTTSKFVIAGSTYYTTGATFNYSAGGSFDSFDFAEVYRVKEPYPDGAVVCPDEQEPIPYRVGERIVPLMSWCRHDACPLAHIISRVPGFCAGMPNYPGGEEYDCDKPLTQAVALVGRAFAQCAEPIPARIFVCSDGAGRVRPVRGGEMALGISLTASTDGMVPLVVRPTMVMNTAQKPSDPFCAIPCGAQETGAR